MRIPDLVMLAVVALLAAAIATGAAFMQRPAAATKKPVYLADQTPVRVVGPAFPPNSNPRGR
jgi:hypothetical protein